MSRWILDGHGIRIRTARPDDAEGLGKVLQQLVAAGKRRKDSDAAFALAHYIVDPQRIRCSVAVDAKGQIAGFQSLKLATNGNPYGTPIGWGIIGTHIRPDHGRRGLGRELFTSTLDAARQAGLPAIEAFIAETNHAAIAFYASLGFRDYRAVEGVRCKRFALT